MKGMAAHRSQIAFPSYFMRQLVPFNFPSGTLIEVYKSRSETFRAGKAEFEYSSIRLHWMLLAACGVSLSLLALILPPARKSLFGVYSLTAHFLAKVTRSLLAPFKRSELRGFEVASKDPPGGQIPS